MDRKGSRWTSKKRRRDNRKVNHPLNRYQMEEDETIGSLATKKLKIFDVLDISVNPTIGYKIINFITVFLTISSFVKCKVCNSDITFEEASCRGLGFKLVVKCKSIKYKNIYLFASGSQKYHEEKCQ